MRRKGNVQLAAIIPLIFSSSVFLLERIYDKDLNLFRHLLSFPWFSTELQFEYLFSGWKGFETSEHQTRGVGAERVQPTSLSSAQVVHTGSDRGAWKPVSCLSGPSSL